jgi:MYXO-CTERM domain-containing protein
VLCRSVDGGARWAEAAARFGGATGVYVSGVDGRDAGVIYLRATAASGEMDGGSAEGSGVLFRSDDGGDTLTEVLRTRGPMRGFAISDDGRSVWAGGPDDGVWRSVDGAAPARLSDEPVDCLRWSAGSLWACRVFEPGGPLLLRSDGASPFVTALAAGDINGPPARCPAGTPNRDICPGRWSVVRRSLVPPGALDASTDRGAVVSPAAPPGDCGCHTAGAGGGPRGRLAAGLAALGAALSRRRRRNG